MTELGELERSHAEFARRNTRVVVASVEGLEEAQKTQADFPHLVVVADAERGLSTAASSIHARSDPHGGDTVAPATVLVDRQGTVKWTFRPDRYLSRLSPHELLAEIDRHLSGGQ